MDENENKKIKGCELLIPTKNKVYSFKIEDSSERGSKKRNEKNLYAFNSDLAVTNYMKYYSSDKLSRRKRFPDVLHIWSLRNEKF